MINVRILLALLIVAPAIHAAAQDYSALWGKDGERWTPEGRLPDFSFAGYHSGDDPLPTVETVTDVRRFGAVGDGVHDDTQAFQDALAITGAGAILIPQGRYRLSDILWIRKPNLVLRGEGPDKTVLVFSRPLEDIRPNPGQTTSGRPTSNYSWSGGLVWVQGDYRAKRISPITSEALRGQRMFTVENAAGIAAGQRVRIEIRDDAGATLLDYLYSGDPGDTAEVTGPIKIGMVSRIAGIDGNDITLERPLRFDLRQAWSPALHSFNPSVSEVGIEELCFEFPSDPYQGHFTEMGWNAIAIQNASDCWVRNVRIRNSDSGIFLSTLFSTIQGLDIESERAAQLGTTGHHGVSLGTDCLLTDFDFRTHFIHDITVGYLDTGNVAKNGRGINLSLDHHKKAPYENLFCNLDLGLGSEMWRCGGGASLGRHCGARGTFWCIRAEQDQVWPHRNFGPDSMNLVGVQTQAASQLVPAGPWFEAIPPERLRPADLHAAQLKRRLSDH